jgi:hypothetical protein
MSVDGTPLASQPSVGKTATMTRLFPIGLDAVNYRKTAAGRNAARLHER